MVHHQPIILPRKQADAHVVGLGPLNIVFINTDVGMVACGAIDVKALEKFQYPAARIASFTGQPIATVADLMAGSVKEVNTNAADLGITVGMGCREALEKM